MIYIWIKRGGLCNQLFQLKHINKIARNKTIITFDFLYKEYLNKSIKILNIRINNKYIKFFAYNLYQKFLSKIINVINEKNKIHKYVNFIDGYWQNTVDEFSDLFSMEGEGRIFDDHNSVGIHIRLRDYTTWNVDGIKDVSLPRGYYLEAIDIISKKVASPFFILFSDDPVLASKLLSSANLNYVVRAGSEVEDLALLGSCKNFILSPSTFSYVGAFMKDSPRKIVIAPRYWIGHKHKYWIPENFIDRRITYINY
jgi:hypothetical protein